MDVDAIETPAELRDALKELIVDKNLTYDAVHDATAILGEKGVGRATLADILTGTTELPRWSTLERIVRDGCGVVGTTLAAWKRAHRRAGVAGIGDALTAQLDPFELGVHKVITASDGGATETLTAYVPRPHDARLAEVVAAAAAGASKPLL